MKVVVVLSAWNGEAFIEDQLRSVLSQLPSDGQIIVRDDGSTDQTVARAMSLDDARLSIIRGANLGFVGSFFALLDAVPTDADLVMLCDQDDVWLPGKIERASERLSGFQSKPALYCSRLFLVDATLQPQGLSPLWSRPPSFQNALAENIVTGCTCVVNRSALELIRLRGETNRIYFHDWWFYLVVSAFGHVVWDSEATVLYRQHGRNVIGMGSGAQRLFSIVRFIGKKNWVHIMFDQIENFRSVHGDSLSPSQRVLIERYFNPYRPGAMLRLLFTPKRFRQSWLYDVLLRLLVLATIVTGRGLTSQRTAPGTRC